MNVFENDINNISKSLSNLGNNKKISLFRDSSCCFRDEYKKNASLIDISKFNRIIEVNLNENYVVAEPNVNMEQITDYLLNLENGPYMLPVTPEFKHITVGGAVNGLGIESTSFKYGLFEKTILKYEILLTNGDIIEATPENKYKDLFYAFPGSYGTLGILTKAYIKIIPTEKYVNVEYSIFGNIKEIEYAFKKKDNIDFMEGLVLKDKVILSVANTVNVSYFDWLFKTSNFNYFWSKWYYNHVCEIAENYVSYEEFIPIKDYLFRWDRGAFWFASNRLSCNLWNRILYGSQLTSKKLYERAKKKNIYEREKQKVVQDLLVPLDNMCEFVEDTKKISGVYPIWLCPIKTFNDSKSLFSLPNDGKIYVDVGVYGNWEDSTKNDFVIKNQKLEAKLYGYGGRKFLCNMNYYNKDFFWEIYDKKTYESLKNKYDVKNNLLDIYDKVCSFYLSLHNNINMFSR